MQGFIRTRNLYKIYPMGEERIHALHDVSLDIARGERICVLGTSGSGKSTLLNMLAGLEPPTKGQIEIGKIRLDLLSEDELTTFRSLNIGFVFQSYNLIPTLNALENVSLGLTFKGIPRHTRNEMAAQILSDVGLGDRLNHRPNELSGGQQQRVSIARAFVGNPNIVFADEPTGNLDSRTSEEVMRVITDLTAKHRQTLLIVTHDEQITDYCERTYRMKDGRIDKVIVNEREIL
ncbi:MAG TPA: ABC transporter ATP-binding protein [Tissierellia bacterium]|jgi:putative ABC transport system ATP-binding protein|nr:ABC transporter ATP-binding protein [Tissierellia bacterium]